MIKMIFNIARVELQILFYSPIAWILLIVFAAQSALSVTGAYDHLALQMELGKSFSDLSMETFKGLFSTIQRYLYFYIPLLTMGLISRELSSKSIRLLYSSPVTNLQIILGKYLAVMVYGLLMIAILLVYVFYGEFSIKEFELGAILTGVLGIYLLLCAYAAIGIFMSSLTSYQIVAAIGTLAVFMLLGMVRRYGQDYDIIRDITWWLAMGGRTGEFVSGLICSEDVLYFIIIISLFIALTTIRLNAVRQKVRFSVTLGKNTAVILIACTLGYFSAQPKLMFYHDATHTKRNTLVPAIQEIIARMEGGLTITSYINILDNPGYARASFLNPDKQRFKQYLRFKPEIKLKYVYYYDRSDNHLRWEKRYPDLTDRERMRELSEVYRIDSAKFKSPEEIRQLIDLSGEGNLFVRRVERESGEKEWLRNFNDIMYFPGDPEIGAAFKRLILDELPHVAFLQGHHERSITDAKDRSYTMFANARNYRYALLNQGFKVSQIGLKAPVPSSVNILVIADMYQPFTPEEEGHLDDYIARGGNLFILGEPRRREVMNPLFAKFGFTLVPGIVVKNDSLRQVDLVASHPTREAGDIAYHFQSMRLRGSVLGTPSVGGLEQVADLGYTVAPLFRTDSTDVWNETETYYFSDADTIRYNPAAGEVMKAYNTVVALSRPMGDRRQKIILSGDADCISNTMGDRRIRRSANASLITGGFFWLSDYVMPIDVRRPPLPDNEITITPVTIRWIKRILLYGIPGLLFIFSIALWLRRRGR